MMKRIPRCITVKLLKISDKEKLFKAVGGESCCYKAIKAKVISDFLPETVQAKRQSKEIFKVLKEQVTSFKQKEMSDRNQNVHEEVQRTRNMNRVDKYRDFCFLLFKSLKS